MTIDVHPQPSGFGAEITGLDLRTPMDQQTYDEVEAALARHGVIFFRNQPLDEAQQEAFIRWFGPPNALAKQLNNARMKNPYFYDVSNVDENGDIMMEDNERRLYLLANLYWHTDMSMRQPPARVTALNARVLPEIDPPDTEFADMRAAWEALPEARKQELESLRAVHSVYASRAKVGYTNFNDETRKLLPPSEHPLIRLHQASGRKHFYMGAHASHIVGMEEEQGRQLLEELVDFATQPQFRYVHKWQPYDLLVWDDSCTMHRATPYDDTQRRELRWCSARELEPV
ncbi:alpha-ketoglutarate-dependent 2%2C4-dichlorophenoxyacetate dioxygenase [Bordetella ansorpii]|uniref:Alpha-ketoglutarate-dependent 2,4-dichlorophenoxyacetate dioxygenase n=1 Tax=Bordetella ansorpii TaxID=288768 RepID=A0A157P4T9_9BORD|nr:TauD/TfdA family dioxygenase [Bordetella ansorpii]SAI27989.1 alpha-ketoglutarate-dependent 2%2C4-dichlorophenoxyacetate dioxygenase [Bordetella ansorpii]